MRSNNQQENKALTPMQKQAVLVCIVCALAALLTIGITLTMLKRARTRRSSRGFFHYYPCARSGRGGGYLRPLPDQRDFQRIAHRDC